MGPYGSDSLNGIGGTPARLKMQKLDLCVHTFQGLPFVRI